MLCGDCRHGKEGAELQLWELVVVDLRKEGSCICWPWVCLTALLFSICAKAYFLNVKKIGRGHGSVPLYRLNKHVHTVHELSNHPGRLTDSERSRDRNKSGKIGLAKRIGSLVYCLVTFILSFPTYLQQFHYSITFNTHTIRLKKKKQNLKLTV